MSAVAVVAVLCLVSLTVLALFSGIPAFGGELKLRRPAASERRQLGPAEILAQQLRLTPAEQRGARFMLLKSLGNMLREQGRYGEAVEHYKEATELAPSGTERAAVLRRRSQAELSLGRLAEAAAAAHAALAAGGGDAAEGAAETLHIVGDVSLEQGNGAGAVETYQKAHVLAVRDGETDEAVLLLSDIGEAHNRAGRVDEALNWLLRASGQLVEPGTGTVSRPAPLVSAKAQSSLAAAYHHQGDVSKATEFYRKAMLVQAAGLRPSHPDLLASLVGLARAQRDLGDVAGALRGIKAVEQTLRSGPNEGPDLSRVLILKADMLRVEGAFIQAQATSEEALRLQEQWYRGVDHREIAVALSGHGSILHDAGNLVEARKRYEAALAMTLRTVGETHPETAAVYNSLGTLFQDSRAPLAAFEKFVKCLEIQRATVGEVSPDVANTYNNMATVLFQQGRAKEAADLLQKALAILDRSGVAEGSPERTLYTENLKEVAKSFEEDAQMTAFA